MTWQNKSMLSTILYIDMIMNLNTSRFVWLITFGDTYVPIEKMYSIYTLYVPIHQICCGKFRLLITANGVPIHRTGWDWSFPHVFSFRDRTGLSSLSFGEFPSLKTWTCCKCLNTKHRSWLSKTKHFNWHVQSQMWSLTCGELCGLEGN